MAEPLSLSLFPLSLSHVSLSVCLFLDVFFCVLFSFKIIPKMNFCPKYFFLDVSLLCKDVLASSRIVRNNSFNFTSQQQRFSYIYNSVCSVIWFAKISLVDKYTEFRSCNECHTKYLVFEWHLNAWKIRCCWSYQIRRGPAY